MSDALVELEGLTDAIPAAIEARKLGTSLGRTVEKLVAIPRQARRFEALVEAAIALGVGKDEGAKRSLSTAVEEAEDIGDMLVKAKTPDDLQYATEDLPKLNQALLRLEGVVRQLWRNLVQTEFQSLVTVGAVLARIPRTEDLGRRLSAVGQEAQELAERNVAPETLAPQIQRLRETRTTLDAELQQLTDNEEVDVFLGAVTRDGATLAHVTPAVIAWLTREEALDAFVVRGGV
jgi:hypothetical protein